MGTNSPAPRDAARIVPSTNLERALADAANGKRSAVSIIYRSERTRMCDAARQLVRDHAAAEDVVHDAFAQILRDAKAFDPARGSARAWIYTIVRNTALRSLQKSTREVATSEEQLTYITDEQAMSRDAAAHVDAGESLKTCLEEMPPLRRATIIMALIDGETHVAIASTLGVPIGTVKSWIRRELVSLREKLE